MISNATKRSILRWIHIIFGIPIVGYIYSPFEEIPNYAPAVRFVFLPIIVLSEFWMWKAMSGVSSPFALRAWSVFVSRGQRGK